MKPGDWTYYKIEFRRTHQTPHCKPENKLKPLTAAQKKSLRDDGRQGWGGCADNWAGYHPWVRKGGYDQPRWKGISDEGHNVQHMVDCSGFWKLKSARRILQNLILEDEKGSHDHLDSGSNRVTQRLRYEFRIIKTHVTYAREVVSDREIIAA